MGQSLFNQELTKIQEEIAEKLGETDVRVRVGLRNILLLPQIFQLKQAIWPNFLRRTFWKFQELCTILLLPSYQYAIMNDKSKEMIAYLNTLPFCLNKATNMLSDRGFEYCIQKSLIDYLKKKNTLFAVAASINKNYQGKGLATTLVKLIRFATLQHGLQRALVPLRPPLKAQYYAEPMKFFLARHDAKGKILDPWLRVHLREGGKLRNICHSSMTIKASIAQWENWTGQSFPADGEYPIPGGLTQLIIDTQANTGTYIEPNVWIEHVVEEP